MSKVSYSMIAAKVKGTITKLSQSRYLMASICHVLCIDGKLLWTDPRTLRNTTCQTGPELLSGVLNVCEHPVW